jgi:hypothetical protein
MTSLKQRKQRTGDKRGEEAKRARGNIKGSEQEEFRGQRGL